MQHALRAYMNVRRRRNDAAVVVPIEDVGPGPGVAAEQAEAKVVLVLDGRQMIRQAGRTLALSAGDALIVPPGRCYREWIPHGDVTRVLLVVVMGSDLYLHCGEATAPLVFTPSEQILLKNVHGDLVRELVIQQDLSHLPERLRARSFALLLEHLDAVLSVGERSYGGGGHPLALRCRERLQLDFASKELSIAALAEEFGVSRQALARTYRQVWGLTPQQELLRMRIEAARRLLLDSDLSVEAVATACGFASRAAFTRRFREMTGNAPTVIRRMPHVGRRTGKRPESDRERI